MSRFLTEFFIYVSECFSILDDFKAVSVITRLSDADIAGIKRSEKGAFYTRKRRFFLIKINLF
jgi:hypothetical protein